MDSLVRLGDKPEADEIYMIAGWQQWANAGTISSGLPQYLIRKTQAQKIGEISSEEFYIFQIPGTHHLLRPQIELEEGYRKTLSTHTNEFFYAGDQTRGLVIFLGEEPHLNEARYAEAFFDVVKELNVKRVVAVGGVYGSMPYDKDREISCAYSLKAMKEELTRYAVRFSNYEGGTTIGTYFVDQAEKRGVEFLVYYAFVPAYDFAAISPLVQGMRIENDFKAWYDLMRRIDHMFELNLDLSDLEHEGHNIIQSVEAKIEDLDRETPDIDIKMYMQTLFDDFKERRFVPLGDMWERELRDLFNDPENE